MAKKKEPIKVVAKSVTWLKNVIGITDSAIMNFNADGFPFVYVYEMYPYGGGDDQIRLIAFREELQDIHVQKRFANSKIRGQLCGDVCMVNIRAV